MPGGYMLNGDYVGPALLAIALLFGMLVAGVVIGMRVRRGSRRQLLLAWLMALILVPPWLLALTADQDIFSIVRIAQVALAVPALAAVWWLRRCIRVFKATHPTLPPLPKPPWLLLAAGVALFGLLDYQSRHRYDLAIQISDNLGSVLFLAGAAMLLSGAFWTLRSSVRWLRLATATGSGQSIKLQALPDQSSQN